MRAGGPIGLIFLGKEHAFCNSLLSKLCLLSGEHVCAWDLSVGRATEGLLVEKM